jgi:hypothetical protein
MFTMLDPNPVKVAVVCMTVPVTGLGSVIIDVLIQLVDTCDDSVVIYCYRLVPPTAPIFVLTVAISLLIVAIDVVLVVMLDVLVAMFVLFVVILASFVVTLPVRSASLVDRDVPTTVPTLLYSF